MKVVTIDDIVPLFEALGDDRCGVIVRHKYSDRVMTEVSDWREAHSKASQLRDGLYHHLKLEFPASDFLVQHLYVKENGTSCWITHMPTGVIAGKVGSGEESRDLVLTELFAHLGQLGKA